MIEHFFAQHPWLTSLTNPFLRIFVIIMMVLICAKLIRMACAFLLENAHHSHGPNPSHGRKHERDKRLTTVIQLVEGVLLVILYGAGMLMILRECGIDITPMLTGAGIAGVAMGFGAQGLVKDVIAGTFILIEDQIRVGDVIKINSTISGAVERMDLRVTGVRDGDGTLHLVSNGEIKSVSNMTYTFSCAVVEPLLSHNTSYEQIRPALEQLASDFQHDTKWSPHLRGPVELVGITGFKPNGFTVQLSVKTEPHSQWIVERELRRRMKQVLDSAGAQWPALETSQRD